MTYLIDSVNRAIVCTKSLDHALKVDTACFVQSCLMNLNTIYNIDDLYAVVGATTRDGGPDLPKIWTDPQLLHSFLMSRVLL